MPPGSAHLTDVQDRCPAKATGEKGLTMSRPLLFGGGRETRLAAGTFGDLPKATQQEAGFLVWNSLLAQARLL